ncbi:MAG: hypothetical protein AAFS11_05735 [Planctomycetota bacterium]
MADGTDKTCVICGKDCSGVARIKDKHGRYACRACAEARRTSRAGAGRAKSPARARPHPRPAAAPADEVIPLADNAAMLDDLPAAPAPTGAPCPSCGMPTNPGAVICLGCGFNMATGAEADTRVKEHKTREPATRPTPARIALGAAGAAGGGAIGLGAWAGLASATGESWYAMAGLLGVLAGVGMCAAVRGVGTRSAGLVSAAVAALVAVPGLALFAPEPTDSFDHGFYEGMPEGWVDEEAHRALAMGEDEGVLAGGVWLGIAALSAYAFGRSNPDDSELDDDNGSAEKGGTP